MEFVVINTQVFSSLKIQKMENDFVNLQIIFDKVPAEYDIGEDITGEIHVTVQKSLSFEYLKTGDFFRINGVQEVFIYPKYTIILAENGIWEIGEIYIYPFKFEGGNLPTYNGHNIEALWYLDATFLLAEDSLRDLNIDNYRKTRPLIWKIEFPYLEEFKIQNKSKKLEVATKKNAIPDGNYYWVFALMVLIFSYLMYLSGNMDANGYVVTSIAVLVLFYFLRLYIQDIYYFRKLDIRFLQDKPKHIQLEILLNGRPNPFKGTRIGYKIVEEVLVDDGDSTTILKHDAFKYLHQEELTDHNGIIAVDMPIVTDCPPSFTRRRHEIKWLLFFEVEGVFSYFTKDIPINVFYEKD
ncbi:MAG: hypothetical protein ACI85O_000763 [Saprospiraceae bacterium]|jgi:hypothetical protein